MDRDALAHQINRIGTRRQRKFIWGGCILFVLLAVLLYTVGVARGNLQASLAFAAIIPIFLTKTLHVFATPRKKRQDRDLPKYSQAHFLSGILFSGASLISIIIVTDILVDNLLPTLVVEIGSSIGLFLIVFSYMRRGAVRRRQAKLAKAERAAAAKAEKEAAAKAEKEAAAKAEEAATPSDEIEKDSTPFDETDKYATPFDEIEKDSTPFDEIEKEAATPFNETDKYATPFDETDKYATPFDETDKYATPFDENDKEDLLA